MNILPKKSWHVRNKDNIARVQRDEAKAAEEERNRKKKAELAEQEARTNFLRKKGRLSLPDSSGSDVLPSVKASRESVHLNLFQDAEEGKETHQKNKEYEEEKNKEKEQQEKALGILTYMGQSASEAQINRPWYQEAPTRYKNDDSTKQEQLKVKLDPLHDMEKYLKRKTGEKKKYLERKPNSKKTEKNRTSKASIEHLRGERLKREAAERTRSNTLLCGKKKSFSSEPEMDDRKRPYNSQYNPEVAQKPKQSEGSWRYAN